MYNNIVIIGGGAIGCSTAYYLAQQQQQQQQQHQHGETTLRGPPPTITLVESTGLANAASGKAGGFLAAEWCDGTSYQELARESYRLHEQLAQTVTRQCDYRPVYALSVDVPVGGDGEPEAESGDGELSWLRKNVAQSAETIGIPGKTAQIHPYKYTTTMARAAEELGVQFITATVTGIRRRSEDNTVTHVQCIRRGDRDGDIDDLVLPADCVVLALGPWTTLVREKWGLTGVPTVTANKAHSVTLHPAVPISPHALFINAVNVGRGGKGEKGCGVPKNAHPEIYPRPDNEVYACWGGPHGPVPTDPAQVLPEEKAKPALHAFVSGASAVLAQTPIDVFQACYLPNSPDGVPIIGAVSKYPGLYMGTGHSVWGILQAPATGQALAQLICGVPPFIDISGFDPDRFDRQYS